MTLMQLAVRLAIAEAGLHGCRAGKMGIKMDNPYDKTLDYPFWVAYNEGFARGRATIN